MGKVMLRLKPFSSQCLQHFLYLLAINLFFIFFVPSLISANNIPSPTIKIGVLAKRGNDQTLKKWGPTAEYLSEKTPGYHFKIVPLDFEGVRLAAMSQSIDFLITNSSYYVMLELDHDLSRVATLENLHGNTPQSLFGGVVFTRADRADINTFNDLIGKSFYAVDKDSLGGWLAAWREFYAQTINPERDFDLLKFSGTHDAVVMAVLNGEADAGTVRTDTLEMMAAEGKISLADFKVLNRQAQKSGFDYLLSTRLYPEWPFAVLPHVPSGLVKDVTVVLLGMPRSSLAARRANIGGWDVPHDYQSIYELLKERHLSLYEKYIGKITLTDFFRKYWLEGSFVIILSLLFVFIAIYNTLLNRQLEQRVDKKTSDLRKEIQERKQTEKERERFLQAIDQSNETIVIADPKGTIQYVNPAFEKITGYTRKESIGLNPCILKSGEHDDVFYQELWATLTRGEIWRGHFLNKKKDGTLYTESATISPVFDDFGKIVNYIAVKRDITREVAMEKELHQKHKMEAVGLMAGGIAHNFNNNLAIILGNVELLQLKQLQGNEFVPLLKNVEIAALRARDLIQNILIYSRKGAHDTKLIQLPLIVNETTNLLRSTIPATINIEQTISHNSNAAMVNADSSQIQEALFNLCNNAVHAMDETGVLKVQLDTVDLQAKDIPIQYDCLPGRHVRLSIQDSGSGMSAETIEKIFDPFFTTKEVGQGTGMGLSTVQGIMKRHNGMIKVTSILGKGTAFDLCFPVIDQNHTVEIKPEDTTLPEGTERILFVDDDKLLAKLGEEILTSVGYQVTTMSSSTKAMKIFAANADCFDLIITDQTMPELSGKDLIQCIKKIRPDVPIILCTGYSNMVDEETVAVLGINAFLTKPVQLSELLQTVRRVLDGVI